MFELDRLGTQLHAELARVGELEASVSSADWVALTGACQEAINVLTAIQAVALAQVAATEDRVCEDGTVVSEFRGMGHQRLDAPALVQDVLGLTAAGATDRVAMAVDVVARHPLDVCVEVVRRIGQRLGTEPGGALRRRTRRLLAAVDADLVRQQAERARSERSLRRSAFEVGVDEWTALVPVEQSRSAWSVVDGLARSYVVQGRCARIDQARADALMDLIHARATGQVGVQLTVPASAMALAVAGAGEAGAGAGEGCDPDIGTVPGDALVPVTSFGMPGVTQVRASWLASVAGGAARGARVVACDDHTGALTSLPLPLSWPLSETALVPLPMAPMPDGHGAYRPPSWLVDFVKARDGHCRFPGCTINARFCDIDHVVAWPTGPTHPSNLACLCRRHHRVKQRPRWRVEMNPGAVLVWTDPCGRVRTTVPPDQLQLDGSMVPVAPAQAKSADVAQPTEATAVTEPTTPTTPTAPPATTKRRCMLPSVLEDEIVLCLSRHHLLSRARLRQRHHVARQRARPGTSSHDPPPF